MIRDYWWLLLAMLIGFVLEAVLGVIGSYTNMVASVAAIRLVHAERRIRRLERRHD